MKTLTLLLAVCILMISTITARASGADNAPLPGGQAEAAAPGANGAAAGATTAPGKNAAAPASDVSGDNLVLRRLSNGFTVAVKKDDRFPLVSLRLYVHAGSAYEDPKEAGISHLLEHMVFKGTEKRPKGAIAAEVERSGGYLNAATSFDHTVYQTDMTKDHWKLGMDVLKDMAFHPSLDPKELESEKEVVIAELKRGEDSPSTRLFNLAQKDALQGTPYARPIIGYENIIRAITRDDILAYISRLYQPQSMLLLVCGNVDVDEAVAEAQKLFGPLENTRPVSPPHEIRPAPHAGFTVSEEYGPWKKVFLSISLPAPSFKDMRSPQFDVLAQVLGGDATSRFYRTYKYDKRLVDDISVSNYSFERLGLFTIQVTLDPDKLVPFWEAFSRDLAGLSSSTFSNEELERARLNIEDDLFRSKETLAGYASKLGYFQFFGNGERDEKNYLQTVKDTGQRVLLQHISETFSPSTLTMAALLPAGMAPPKGETSFAAWAQKTLTAQWKVPAVGSSHAAAPAADTGKEETLDLGKGRTLVLLPDNTLPYASATLAFTGGDSLLSKKKQGLGAFTASLLTKGTKKMNATAMEEFLSDRAASLTASSGRLSFALNLSSPDRFTGDMFGMLRDVLFSPAFMDEEAARVRENQVAAITMREDQPTGLAFRRLFPFLFKDHPYGFLQLGEADKVQSFTAKDARDFWKRQVKQPWTLAVCGAFNREAVIAAAKNLPVPSAETKESTAPEWNDTRDLTLHLPNRNQAHLFMVFPAVGVGDPDEAGLELLQNILQGQSGLLFHDLRDVHGLGYTVTAIPWKTEKAGAIIFYIGTDPDKVEQAKAGFLRVIDALHSTPLEAKELERGKNQMTGDYFRDHQSLGARCSEAAALSVLHRPLDFSRKLVEQAQKVDAAELQELSKKYLVPENAYIMKVLP